MANAAILRKLWIFEQISSPPIPTLDLQPRHQFIFETAQFKDSLSYQASFLYDFNWVEARLRAATRSFFSKTEQGTVLKDSLSGERDNVHIEIARQAMSSKGHFGRLGIGYLAFFPGTNKAWVTFACDTGIHRTDTVPWDFNFHVGLFSPSHNGFKVWSFEGRSARYYTLPAALLSAGGEIQFSIQTLDEDFVSRVENRLVSFGPVTTLHSERFGKISLQAKWRLWIDTERIPNFSDPARPSELSAIPDVEFQWGVVF